MNRHDGPDRDAAVSPGPGTKLFTMHAELPRGTRVFTQDGAFPVEYLSRGNRVITRRRGHATACVIHVVATPVPMAQLGLGALGVDAPATAIDPPAAQEEFLCDWRAKVITGRTPPD